MNGGGLLGFPHCGRLSPPVFGDDTGGQKVPQRGTHFVTLLVGLLTD